MTVFDEQGRPEPPLDGDELSTALGFLDFQRATVAWRTEGLDATGMAATVGVSSITLGGLLKHLAYVEDHWFVRFLHGRPASPPWDSVDWKADPDWDWNSAAHDSPEELGALWRAAVDRSNASLAEALATGDLGQLSVGTFPSGERVTLRWILVHLVEEYSRHNGHADLIRETVDGQRGE